MASRGKFILFADADGATRFSDLDRLEVRAKILDESNHAGCLVVGSRAHMVDTDVVVKVRDEKHSYMVAVTDTKFLNARFPLHCFHALVVTHSKDQRHTMWF